MDDTVFLRCEAIAWVSRDWPSWIRVRLIDSACQSWFFVDNVPIFVVDDSSGAINFPAPALIRCQIVDEGSDDVITVSTAAPDIVEAEDGTTEFGYAPARSNDTRFRNSRGRQFGGLSTWRLPWSDGKWVTVAVLY
jgi:hypothetical protein